MEKELRDNISRIRQEKNISQKEMAEKLGISRASYISLEKGRTRLLNENVEKFAALNNVSPSELVLGYRVSEDVHTLHQAQAEYGRKRQEIIDAYEERIAALNQEIEGLNRQISDLRDSIDTKNDVIAMLRARLSGNGLSEV